MKKFLNSRTWEDWFIYGVVGIIVIGGLLFVIGYMFSFNADFWTNIFTGEKKTSISKMIKDESYPDNLFSLMTYLINNEMGSTAYNMCVTAMTGVALLFFIVAIITFIMVWVIIVDIIIYKVKAKRAKKN